MDYNDDATMQRLAQSLKEALEALDEAMDCFDEIREVIKNVCVIIDKLSGHTIIIFDNSQLKLHYIIVEYNLGFTTGFI